MNKFKMRNNKKQKTICIAVIIVSILMICLFSYLLYVDISNRPLINYPKYSLSTLDWTSDNVVITIDSENGNISSYSFDGGINYQEANTYEVLTNGDFSLVVKDKNGRESKKIFLTINNIDKDEPIISFLDNTTILVGSTFSLRSGVNAYDEGSGLNNNYVVTPDKIDTNVAGTYVVKYTAFDNVGNYTEKSRTITVVDSLGTTYYRYRTATIETYQCEPYLCNCVESKTALDTASCPTGYTFNAPNKCCPTCYKSCKKTVWSNWSDWSLEQVTPTQYREVETKIEKK